MAGSGGQRRTDWRQRNGRNMWLGNADVCVPDLLTNDRANRNFTGLYKGNFPLVVG